MKKYIAVKYFGHYVCAYIVEAQNEKDAYNSAIYGKPIFTEVLDNFYGEGGFVKRIDTETTLETQIQWLIEAIELGYPANAEQHKLVFGLPFVIPGVQYTC